MQQKSQHAENHTTDTCYYNLPAQHLLFSLVNKEKRQEYSLFCHIIVIPARPFFS